MESHGRKLMFPIKIFSKVQNAEFVFFGQEGSIILGKEVDYLLQETRARNEGIPREISDLIGKEFIVTVMLHDNTFNSDHYHFPVKSTWHVANPELLAPLPLHTHLDPAGQSSSSVVVPTNIAYTETDKLLEDQASFTEKISKGKKHNINTSPSEDRLKKRYSNRAGFLLDG